MSSKKHTPRDLVLAIIAGDVARVKKLHSLGVSVCEADEHRWIPLHRAAANNAAEIIRLLVEWGSPVEACGNCGWTPLHLAAISRSDRAILALLQCGAKVDSRSESKSTPLHLAVTSTITERLLESVRILLEAGADPDAVNAKGETPIGKARQIGDRDLLRVFAERG